MSKKSLSEQFDYAFLFLFTALAVLGLLTLYSASHGPDGEVASFAGKQIRWLLLGLSVMGVCYFVDYRNFQNASWALYAVLIAMLVAVLVLGKTSMGAQRWLGVGALRIQPSEFMKIGIAITIAHVFAMEPKSPPYGLKQLLLPAGVTLLPALLVLVQPDLGTALLIICVASAITVFQGLQKKVTILLAAGVSALTPLFWFMLKDYQKNRILTFINPERDPMGAGYHIIQSKIAIGSGQILGKGYLKGTQSHLRFLPERHTDFIFAVFAEEWGLLGCIVAVTLFGMLILWGLDIAAKARDTFGRLLAVGLTAILFAHVVVNIGMVMGLLPVVGVPLPLFSYGGSSVLTTCIVVGILLNIRKKRFARH